MEIKLSVLTKERKRQAVAELGQAQHPLEIFEIMTWVTVDDVNKMP